MKKKIVSLCLVVALAATAVIGGTLAYFTDTEEATNTITTGNVSIQLYESQYHRGAPTGYLAMTGQKNPTTDEHIIEDSKTYDKYLDNAKLMPFDLKSEHRVQSMFEECTVAKNAYVQNTGDNDCFVRVRYMVPEAIAEYLDIFYVGTQFITADDKVAEADARTLDNTDKTEPMITAVDSSEGNFAKQCANEPITDKDGNKFYVADFIYAERLTSGEMTLYSPISKITMIPSVTNEQAKDVLDADGKFAIKVEAHAIQADGFLNAVEAFAALDGANN